MIVEDTMIRQLTEEEKQVILDAVILYSWSESDMGKSNHFAADVHAEIAKMASHLSMQMHEAWGRFPDGRYQID